MEKIAPRPSPFHAQRADDRISTRTPPSTHTSVSTSHHRAPTSADGSPPRHHCADISADGSPTPYSQYGGGGGGLPDNREKISQEDEGGEGDAISLLPAEDIPVLPQESKFRVFQNNINKTSESLASPLPEDMASCFNTTYHKNIFGRNL